jgi:alpha-beta hydrolase superfamily lysophospholipase
MSQLDISWINNSGLKVHAQEWRPPGEARAVVALVHGLGEHIGRYQHVAGALNQSCYTLIGSDLPGHGLSGGPRGCTSYLAAADQVDCLLAEAAQRYPGKPCFLYGHSMGGAIVLQYVLTHRPGLKGVIVTSPGLAPGSPVPGWKVMLAKTLSGITPNIVLANGLDQDNLSHDPAVVRAYGEDPRVHDRVSARLGFDLLTRGDGLIQQANTFPLPLLLMQGNEDHIASPQAARAFAQAVPADKITYKEWPGLFHEIHNEPQQQEVLQFMIDWLDTHCC